MRHEVRGSGAARRCGREPGLAAALLSIAAALLPPGAGAQQRSVPKWEAGIALGAGYVVDYPGADESHARGLIAPVLVYRGPLLRIDRDGVRGRLFDSDDWEFDVGASAAFNARDNEARAGMPDLDYLLGVGPRLVYKGLRGVPGQPSLSLEARALVSTDLHDIAGRGAAFGAELRWRFRPSLAGAPLALTLEVQPTWATRSLHRYFYEVGAEHATASRPAYRAKSGYLGSEFNVTASRRIDERLSWFAGIRGLSLHGAANSASPLLRSDWNWSAGAGVVWTPWRSQARVADTD